MALPLFHCWVAQWPRLKLLQCICISDFPYFFCIISHSSSSVFYVFLNHVILLFLRFYFFICFENRYWSLSLKTSTFTNSKPTFPEKFLPQQHQSSGLLHFAIAFYNVLLVTLLRRLGIIRSVMEFLYVNC
jgi:hypothetical protein